MPAPPDPHTRNDGLTNDPVYDGRTKEYTHFSNDELLVALARHLSFCHNENVWSLRTTSSALAGSALDY